MCINMLFAHIINELTLDLLTIHYLTRLCKILPPDKHKHELRMTFLTISAESSIMFFLQVLKKEKNQIKGKKR